MFKRATMIGVGLSLVASCALFAQQETTALSTQRGMVLLSGIDVTSTEKSGDLQRVETALGFAQGELRTGDGLPLLDAGPASIVVEALLEGSFQQPFRLEEFQQQSGDERCATAREEKIAFHLQNSGAVPPSFGKIVRMDLKNYEGDLWAGELDVCTWIREGTSYDEYFFQMRFLPDLPGTVRTVKNQGDDDPFPDTLDLSLLEDPSAILDMMQDFAFKLHGSEEAVEVAAAFRNGQLLPASDEVYIQDGSCFDFFLRDEAALLSMQSGVLPPQLSYCMGRCNALILNTY